VDGAGPLDGPRLKTKTERDAVDGAGREVEGWFEDSTAKVWADGGGIPGNCGGVKEQSGRTPRRRFGRTAVGFPATAAG
jgi:hypothetical protein